MVRKRKTLQTKSLTKKEFIARYLQNSKVSLRFLKSLYVCLPCNCGHVYCPNWAMVNKDLESIKRHKKMYQKKNTILDLNDFEIEFIDSDFEIIGKNELRII